MSQTMTGETIIMQLPGAQSSARDEGGKATRGTPPDPQNITGCALAPIMSDETADNVGNQTIVGWHVYRRSPLSFPPETTFTVRSIGGYQAEGTPSPWTNPYDTLQKGVEFVLRLAV